MSPRSSRVAIVGAPTTHGIRLREALEKAGVSGSRVDMYGTSQGEVLLSEYAGEARMILEPDLDEIAGHDVIFICERGEWTAGITTVASDALIIDMLGCLAPPAPRVHVDINPERVGSNGSPGHYTVPHPLSLLLAELLHPLDRGPGIVEASAVVLRPAADYGEQGLEELRQQTVRLLSFSEVPTETFGRQLAFNVIPQSELTTGRPDPETRIVDDVTELLGWEKSRLAVKLVTAPVFYGHAVQLRFRPRSATRLEELRRLIGEAGLSENDGPPKETTPLDVTGEIRTRVADVSEDGLGGFWLWIVAGEADSKGADQAMQIVTRLGALS